MKVCIVGAGAIGGLMAARVAGQDKQSAAVSVLARGNTLDAIRRDGLRVFSRPDPAEPDNWQEQVQRVTCADDAAELGPQDLIIISVKYNAMPQIARSIAPLLHQDTVVLSAMNGVPWWFTKGLRDAPAGLTLDAVDPGREISAALDPGRVIGCVVHMAASTRAPGVVQLSMGNRLVVGEPGGGQSERLNKTAQLLSAAGFDVEVSNSIEQIVWYKLWGNMTVNPISAITGAQTDAILADDDLRGYLSAMMREANAVGTKLGLHIDEEPEERHKVTARLGGFKTSMLQDVLAGKPLELDALVTVVRDLGRQVKVPTPHIDALLGMTRVFARTHGLLS